MPRRGYRYEPKDYDAPNKEPGCAMHGCGEIGEFRAPLGRDALGNFQMLCAEHIKEFNKKWDYFAGMSQAEIEAFQKDAFTGHRPTWKPDLRQSEEKLQAAFAKFMEGDESIEISSAPPIPPKQKRALALLDMQHPTTQAALKKQYKTLVKKHHPDVNPDNPKAEETFKALSEAYQLLKDEYEEAIADATQQ